VGRPCDAEVEAIAPGVCSAHLADVFERIGEEPADGLEKVLRIAEIRTCHHDQGLARFYDDGILRAEEPTKAGRHLT
jgi:hypothetical protein